MQSTPHLPHFLLRSEPRAYLDDQAVVSLGEERRVVVDVRDVDVDHGGAGEGGHAVVRGHHGQRVPRSLANGEKSVEEEVWNTLKQPGERLLLLLLFPCRAAGQLSALPWRGRW